MFGLGIFLVTWDQSFLVSSCETKPSQSRSWLRLMLSWAWGWFEAKVELRLKLSWCWSWVKVQLRFGLSWSRLKLRFLMSSWGPNLLFWESMLVMSLKLWLNCGKPQFEVIFPQKLCFCCGVHFPKIVVGVGVVVAKKLWLWWWFLKKKNCGYSVHFSKILVVVGVVVSFS